jgi:hypothetical protein
MFVVEAVGLQGTEDYSAIAAVLNAKPTVPNPAPQGTVKRPYYMLELFSLMAQTEKFNLMGVDNNFRQWAHSLGPDFPGIDSLLRLIAVLTKDASGEKSFIQALKEIVATQSKDNLLALADVLYYASLIGLTTRAAIATYADQTMPDPAYQATVTQMSLAELMGLSVVDEFVIQEALN